MTSLVESEAARRALHFRALERRLFEILGGWVPTVGEAEAKLLLRSHSFHHAWHAQLWAGLLPTGQGEGTGALEGCGPGPAVADVLDALEETTDTVERLVGVYRVLLPRLVTVYSAHRQVAGEPSDGPLARVLTLMLADDTEAWRAGEAVLERLLTVPAAAERAAARAGMLEALLVAGCGLDVTRSSEGPRE